MNNRLKSQGLASTPHPRQFVRGTLVLVRTCLPSGNWGGGLGGTRASRCRSGRAHRTVGEGAPSARTRPGSRVSQPWEGRGLAPLRDPRGDSCDWSSQCNLNPCMYELQHPVFVIL